MPKVKLKNGYFVTCSPTGDDCSAILASNIVIINANIKNDVTWITFHMKNGQKITTDSTSTPEEIIECFAGVKEKELLTESNNLLENISWRLDQSS